jgi:CHAT domain-containing protein/tetratricopeptide (TPR) repeat protein
VTAPARARADDLAALRARVTRALKASEEAAKRHDEAAVREHAEEADRLARRSLPRTDPIRAKAVRTLGRLRCDAARKQKDAQAELTAAEESRDATAEAAASPGELDTAVDWAQYARKLAKQLKERDPSGKTRARVELALARLEAQQAQRANKPAIAAQRLRQAVQLGEQVLPNGDPSRLDDLLSLAALLRGGSADEALRLYDRIAEESKRGPGENVQRLVAALVSGASLQMGRDDGEPAAISRLVAAARVVPAGPAGDTGLLDLLDELFWNQVVRRADRQQDLATREAWLRDTTGRIEIALKDAHAPSTWIAQGSLRLARFQFEHQRMDATEATLRPVTTALDELKAAPLLLGDYWTLRGNVETELANFDTARRQLVQAYDAYAAARHKRQAPALNNLGQLLVRMGDYRIALFVLGTAVRLYRSPGFRDDVGLAFALNNLAKALEGDDEVRKAEERYGEAIKLLAAVPAAGEDTLYPEFLCHMNLGVNILSRGDAEEANTEFLRARDLAARAFAPDGFHAGEVHVNLGWVALALAQPNRDEPANPRRLDEARTHFHSALETFQSRLGKDHPRTAEAMSYLARIDAAFGKHAEATRFLNDAIDLRESYLARMFRSALSEYDREALVRALRMHAESPAYSGVLDTFLELAPALKIPVCEQYRRMLSWKGIIASHAPPLKENLENDPDIRALAGQREDVLKRLRSASSGGSATALAVLEAEVDQLERRLAERSPRFRRGRDDASLTVDQITRCLEPDWAFLDVLQISLAHTSPESTAGDHRYLGFLVRPGKPLVRIDFPGTEGKQDIDSGTDIDMAVLELRKALDRTDDTYLKPSARLKTAIRDPLVPHLKGVNLLIVSMDGQLHRLPLSALTGERPGSYWIEDLSFTTVSAARSLVARRSGTGSAGTAGALIVGGLEYGNPEGQPFKRLPATAAEAQTVARLFGLAHADKPEVLTKGDATLSRIVEALSRRRFVHIATHGFYTGPEEGKEGLRGVSAKLDSGLVLSAANSRRPDTVLSSERISLLDLRSAELVVLSACQSALGHVRAGQGTTGLLDAFDQAGAGSIVCALRKVDDEATAALMASFYQHLWQDKLAPAQALRAAELEFVRGQKRSSSGQLFANPYFWAAFQVGGVPRTARRVD